MKGGRLREKSLFLFDLDGVFYRGKESRVKIGGTAAIRALREKGKKLFVLTNNSTDTVETVHRRLADFGIPFEKEEVLTSALLTAEYLREGHGRVSYFLVGEEGLAAEMAKQGHRRVTRGTPDFVVIGLDRGITYEKLDRAARCVREGSALVATHMSRLYMYKNGPAMATGPIVKAIEYASRRKAIAIGKPSRLMFEIALRRAGSEKGEAVMVGDQVDTDLAGAHNAGIDSILVTSGVDKGPGVYAPLAVLRNVDELVGLL
jgi:HAD superfamily hydrolase (TIGR01450 family)